MKTIDAVVTAAVQWNQGRGVARRLLGITRGTCPVIRLGNDVFVFRYRDVVDVLSRDQDFGVTPAYAYEMAQTSGEFFLGMEDGPRYARERAFAETGSDANFLQVVDAQVRAVAQECLQQKRGRFDFVEEFAREVPYQLLSRCFGIPGPTPELMKEWLDLLFWDLFLNLLGDRDIRARARQAGQQLQRYLFQRVAELRSARDQTSGPGEPGDSFLSRLVRHPNPDDELIVRNMGGIAIGAFSTQAKALTLVLQELLSRPETLAEATEAALCSDDQRLSGYVFEALRFNPHNALIVRHAMQPTTLGQDTRHPIHVHTGARVFAMTLSASFDPAGFPQPARFDPTRPFDHYLHFGFGMHRCFGAQIVKTVLTAALSEVLRRGVRAARPAPLAVMYNGPFPSAMPVTSGAGSLSHTGGLRRAIHSAGRHLDQRAVG